MDALYYFDRLLNDFTIKLATVGLEEEDYPALERAVRQIASYSASVGYELSEYVRLHSINNKTKEEKKEIIKRKKVLQDYFFELTDIRNRFIALREALKEILPFTIEEFLNQEASLMHLVYGTNHYDFLVPPKIKGRFKSTFLCHFHKERTASMEIDSLAQYGFCYGCGVQFDLFSYFSNIEGISKEEAIDLLCRIYLIDKVGNKVPETDDRIKKYQDILTSNEYKRCLFMSLEKVESMPDSLYKIRCLNKINKDLETIDRIKNKKIIYFRPTSGAKRLTLDWKELYE